MKTQADMRAWLDKDRLRKIRPLLHSSGWLVELMHDSWVISSMQGATIEEAFTAAERNFDTILKSLIKSRIHDAKAHRDVILRETDDSLSRLQKLATSLGITAEEPKV
jgi:predicted RNase H-like HicB family nuclease